MPDAPPIGIARHRELRVLLAVLCLASAGGPASAEELTPPDSDASEFGKQERPDSVPQDAVLEAEGAVIGEIELVSYDVFDVGDPKENKAVFRFANRLHVRTRERVIRRELLFGEGDPYVGRELAESERLLRDTRLFYDARVLPVRYQDGRVDVRVITRDVWTLTGGVNFGRSGGENTYSLGIEDKNLLGTGKELKLERTVDVDRTSDLFRYRDPRIAGTRLQLRLLYQDNSDGFLRQLVFGRPFYSFETKRAALGSALTFDRVDPLYTLGEVRYRFRHIEDSFTLQAGFSRGLKQSSATRFLAGLTYARNRFETVPEFPSTDELPANRTLVYPWIGYELAQERFARMRNLDRIERTEDLNFGTRIEARAGWSSTAFGADRNQAILAFAWEAGFTPGPRRLLLANLQGSGRWGSAGSENVLVRGGARFFWRNVSIHQFHAALSVALAEDLDGESQLLLGGDSGLRGYPLRYQEGDRRFLLTLEQRFYTPWHILRLARLGAAVFADAGAAWFVGGRDDPADLGLLRDVGIGLRLQSTRSSGRSILHIDLAFPLDARDDIASPQLVVRAKERF